MSAILVTTKSGSVYRLDREAKTFSRVNTDPNANVLMLDQPEMEGELTFWPRIEVGEPLFLYVHITKPEIGMKATTIRSTRVVAIVEEDYVEEVVVDQAG